MNPQFVIRFDDISPRMAWSKFTVFDELSKELDLPFLVGVIPNCLDSKLTIEAERVDFWDVVRHWSRRGWTIAQHGYTHQYVTKNPGILKISNNSELAGLTYMEQLAKIDAGKAILVQQGVWRPVFMAPSHSFDEVTVKVLSELEFCYLTDGYGVYPYRVGSLTALPQLFSGAKNFGFGIYTICLHVNTMTPVQMSSMIRFIRENRAKIISFEQAVSASSIFPGVALAVRLATSVAIPIIRNLIKRRRA